MHELTIRVANRALRRLPPSRPLITYEVEGFPLLIPLSHPLPRILAVDRLYQAPLRILAEALSSTTDNPVAIDIGANVGDTAVTMALGGCKTVVCVEGNPAFLPILRSNAQRAEGRAWRFETVDRFVSIGDDHPGSVETKFGTARLVDGPTSQAVPTQGFITAIELLNRCDRIDILKIDTDGMDLQILRECLSVDRDDRIRSLFFEYTPAAEDLASIVDELSDQGFNTLFWFNHRGAFVRSTDTRDAHSVNALSASALARREYFDIAALRGPQVTIDRFTAACGRIRSADESERSN